MNHQKSPHALPLPDHRSPRTGHFWTVFVGLAVIAYGVFVYYGATQVLAARMAVVSAQCKTGELLCR